MIKFYYNTSPNPMKIALFLEEANLDYEAIPIDTRKGEQHKDNYLKINSDLSLWVDSHAYNIVESIHTIWITIIIDFII